MVTGFNSDVRHEGRVYHVQTEDKGVGNPIIETLIYSGGEILAARRASYADLLDQGADEALIGGRLEEQHNQVLAEIKAGRYAVKKHRPFGEGIISNKSFDEVVLDYLSSLTDQDRMALVMLESERFVEGSEARLELQVKRGANGQGVPGAAVKIKLHSSAGKARVLTQGKTGIEGRATFTCRLPVLAKGTGVLIIQAISGKESAEIKQAIDKPAQ
jgi:hypothetical protein